MHVLPCPNELKLAATPDNKALDSYPLRPRYGPGGRRQLTDAVADGPAGGGWARAVVPVWLLPVAG